PPHSSRAGAMEWTIRRMARLAVRVGAAAAVATALLALGIVAPGVDVRAQQDGGQPPRKDGPQPEAKVKLGLSINDHRAFRGYVVFNPMGQKFTYLIDRDARVVKEWKSEHNSMHAAYLLENGHLFRVA